MLPSRHRHPRSQPKYQSSIRRGTESLFQSTESPPTPPTPTPSSRGLLHPRAAQQFGQVAGVSNPAQPSRPSQSYAPVPSYPAFTPLPLSLHDLIANESLNQQDHMVPLPQPRPKPQEEVCVECMMRDRDLADVDVTSPGVWSRPRDADYEDLVRGDREEDLGSDTRSSLAHERQSIAGNSSSSRPASRRVRARDSRLTEEGIRKWILVVRTLSWSSHCILHVRLLLPNAEYRRVVVFSWNVGVLPTPALCCFTSRLSTAHLTTHCCGSSLPAVRGYPGTLVHSISIRACTQTINTLHSTRALHLYPHAWPGFLRLRLCFWLGLELSSSVPFLCPRFRLV